MNFMEKLKLTAELDKIANAIQDGGLSLMQRVEKVRRIDQIILALTGGAQQSAKTLALVVQRKQGAFVSMREPYTFQRGWHDFLHNQDADKANEYRALMKAKPKGSVADTLMDQLELDFDHECYIKWRNDGMQIDTHLLPSSPLWTAIEWMYSQKYLLVQNEETSAETDASMPLLSAEEQKAQANEDFEQEAESAVIDPPADEAGAFYQSVIDGAEIDAQTIQTALDYANQDDKHYLLPEAAEVIKNNVLKLVS